MSYSLGFTCATEISLQRIWNMDLIWIKMKNGTNTHSDSFAVQKCTPKASVSVCAMEQTKPKVIVTILICVNGLIETSSRLVSFMQILLVLWIHKTYICRYVINKIFWQRNANVWNGMSFAQRKRKLRIILGCWCRLFLLLLTAIATASDDDEHSSPHINNKNHLSEKALSIESYLQSCLTKISTRDKNGGTVHFKLKNYYAASELILSTYTQWVHCALLVWLVHKHYSRMNFISSNKPIHLEN